MKKRGAFIALVFLLTAIGTATLAQLQSCSTDVGQTTGTSALTRLKTSQTTDGSQKNPQTSMDAPVGTGSLPETGATSGTVPQTAPVGSVSTSSSTTPVTPSTTKPIVSTPTLPEDLGFVADLSAFEKYMNPTGSDWDNAYLLLVNADHPIGKDAELGYSALNKLVKFRTITAYNHKYKPDILLNEAALQALTAMFIEAKAEGISDLYATSAHRTYAYQTTLFNSNVNRTKHWSCASAGNDWIGKSAKCAACGTTSTTTLPVSQEEKENNVATYSCRPGTSDHQTGLAVDIIQSSLPSEYSHLIQEFGDTEAGKWLAANAHKFGFVLRFPEDKENITGIIYEPWHFRFVGREHATIMYENNLCLEEYVAYLEQTGYFAS